MASPIRIDTDSFTVTALASDTVSGLDRLVFPEATSPATPRPFDRLTRACARVQAG
jgi:hypothetical protein